MKKIYFLIFYLILHSFAYCQADLLVNTFTISTNGNDPVYVGNTITGTFTVKNAGNIVSDKCFASIYISPTSDYTQGYFLGKISMQSVGAGQTTSDIIFKYPIPYTIVNDGNYSIILYINQSQSITEQNYNNNSFALQIPSLVKGKQSARAAQNLPYPIIFIHGLNSCDTTWNALIDSLQKHFGWSYGGNMNFCLNFDGNYSTSDSSKDYKDFTLESVLRKDDFYTVNFDVSQNGVPVYTLSGLTKTLADINSNQSAIVKQGLAVRDAIKHVMKITGKDKVILVGHSMGGLAAREYLQNSNFWIETKGHHVAKLLTIGTPHGGSNADLGALDIVGLIATGLDVNSEAVRDLRTSYSYPPYNKGVYLFGGNESLVSMVDNFGTFFYNADVNCDGIESGEKIIGINDNVNKPIPLDLPYTCLIGISNKDPYGDRVVSEKSANLNNYFGSSKADTFKVIEPNSWNILNPLDIWHTALTSQFKKIMQGIDEPNSFNYAYNVDLDKLYYGNLTVQSGVGLVGNIWYIRDRDCYSVDLKSAGKLQIQVYNIPVSDFSIEVYSSNNILPIPIKTISCNGLNYINLEKQLDAGKYYLVLSGTPTDDSWKSAYSFQLTLNASSPAYSTCLTSLTAKTDNLGSGTGSLNYTNNTDCSWLINPPDVSSITLRFNSFSTEVNNDTVNVYDGSDSTYPLLGKFSGNSLPAAITSTGSTMFVTFKTNNSVTASGWDATYTTYTAHDHSRTPAYTTGYKYWFDGDITTGNTVIQNLSNVDSVYALLQIPATFKTGFHTISCMVQQSDKYWSVPVTNNFYYSAGGGAILYEYWYDTAYSSRQSVQTSDTTDLVLTNELVTADGLINGFHQFNIRFKPSNGLWSAVQSSTFFKRGNDVNAAMDIKQLAYWFDTSFSNRKTLTIARQNGEISNLIDCTNLSVGKHSVNYQTMDNGNIWSAVFVDSFTVTCIPPETPVINSKNTIAFCQGLNDTLISNIVSGNQWYLDGVLIVGANDSSYVATVSGNYCVVASSNGCISDTSNRITINVKSIPAKPVITSVNDTIFCRGANDTLVSSAADGNQWYLNDSAIAGASNNRFVASTSGNYSVVATVDNCSSSRSSSINITVNPLPQKPVITSGNTTTFCVGDVDTLTSDIGSGIQWCLNGAAITGANNKRYVAMESGIYSVVASSNNCISDTSNRITISVKSSPVQPIITSIGDTVFCRGFTDTLVSSAAEGNQWYLNGSAIAGAINNKFVASSGGKYTVIATTNNCSSSASSSINVMVNPVPSAPVITSRNSTSFCIGGVDTLISSAADGNQWFLNDTAINGATGTIFSAIKSGHYTVTTNNGSCTSQKSLSTQITVFPLPVKPVITNSRSFSFCSGDSTILISSANSGNQWYLNNIAISGATGVDYTVKTSGTYTVVATNSSGCSGASDTITIISNPNPLRPVITSKNATRFCSGEVDTLLASSTIGNHWYVNGTAISGARASSYVAKLSGSYTDTIINQNGCKSGSSAILINVTAITTPTVSQKSDTLISSAASGNQWYLNGILIPGAINQKYKALSSGLYTVIVTDLSGCSSAVSIGLPVVVTAINNINLNSKDWKIFPNPMVNGILYIKRTGNSLAGKAKAQISTQDGRLIAEKTIGSSSQWDLRGLSSGVYYLRIIENKTIFLYQIIK